MAQEIALSSKHLLGLEHSTPEDIMLILENAKAMQEICSRPIKKVPVLRGKTVVNLFFEPSTRTRSSFEIAAKRLSADSLNFSPSSSSLSKGETLVDTALTINAMGPDMAVIRHSCCGAPALLTKYLDIPIINAGDGKHEHPTQALLDMFTIQDKLGTITDLDIAIVGDITHSRVARSNIYGMTKLGNRVRLCGPPTMIPHGVEKLGVTVYDKMDEAVQDADIVMMLRVQLERQKGYELFPSLREYNRLWGLSSERLKLAKPNALVMHPGPVNRGVEINLDVLESSHSVVLDQVASGVAVRMAILYLLSAPGESAKEEQ
jgi:aspartate carbamoyltransferase catalytic subunit